MYKNVNYIFIRLEYKDNRNTSQADIPAFVSKALHVRSKPANTQLPYCTSSQCRALICVLQRKHTYTHKMNELLHETVIYYTHRKSYMDKENKRK